MSDEIDLFCLDEAPVKSTPPSSVPIALNDSPVRGRRYHSIQLGIVIGIFGCGGFLCSLLFVDSGDDFPQPHHWLQKSYNSPAMILPPSSPGARVIPQNVPLRPTHEDKASASERRRISDRKSASPVVRTDHTAFGLRPVADLRTKWTNFSESVRDRAESLNSTRLRVLDFGRRLRQCHFEAGRISFPENTDKDTDDAG